MSNTPAIHPLLECILDRRASDASVAFDALVELDATDLLWAGHALVVQGQARAGLELLLRAVEGGSAEAPVFVGVAYHQLGEVEIAAAWLERSHPTTQFVSAVLARERGWLLVGRGRLREAVEAFEAAWQIACRDRG